MLMTTTAAKAMTSPRRVLLLNCLLLLLLFFFIDFRRFKGYHLRLRSTMRVPKRKRKTTLQK